MSDVIAVNANDPQTAQLDLLVRTLRDPDRGAFHGRICVVTTGVSRETKEHFRRWGVEFFESDLEEFVAWDFAPVIGAYEPLKLVARDERKQADAGYDRAAAEIRYTRRAHEMAADPAQRARCLEEFRRYMPKHFSKFNLLKWLAREAPLSGRIMLLDSDLVFQGPAQRIFERVRHGQCLVEYEKESMEGDYFVARSNRLALQFPRAQCLRFGRDAHEVNVGFLCAHAETLREIMLAWKDLMLRGGLEPLFVLHSEDFWHEQDFFRLLHDTTPERFAAAGKELVYHCVHAAAADIEEVGPREFQIRGTGVRPVLVHFAGGFWRKFPSVKRVYQRPWTSVATPSGRSKTIIFGSGTDGRRFLEEGEPGQSVVAVLDNDVNRQRRGLPSMPVLSPDDFPILDFDRVRIASSATAAIYRQLRGLGVDECAICAPLFETENRRRLDALRDCHRGAAAVVCSASDNPDLRTISSLDSRPVVTLFCGCPPDSQSRASIVEYCLLDASPLTDGAVAALLALRGSQKLLPDVLLRYLSADERTVLYGLDFSSSRAASAVAVDPYSFGVGPSIGHVALQWAIYMGFSAVWFAGSAALLGRSAEDASDPAATASARQDCQRLLALADARGVEVLDATKISGSGGLPRLQLVEPAAEEWRRGESGK